MVNLISGANQQIGKDVYAKDVQATYITICDAYHNGYTTQFVRNMQDMVTKIGQIVAKYSTDKKRINYCYGSIQYLCKTVLDNPALAQKFDSIHLNNMGNQVKHTLHPDLNINMDKWVEVFNELLNAIINRYQLSSLKPLIIKKKASQSRNNAASAPTFKNVSAPQDVSASKKKQPTPPPAPKAKTANDSVAASDERLKLFVNILKGDGRYSKGLIKKEPMFNFNLDVDIINPDHLKITEITAEIKSGGSSVIKTIEKGKTSIDISAAGFSGKITAVVTATYKLGLLKTKKLKTTASKLF